MSSLDEFPEILTAKHIAYYLSLTPKTIYELFKLNPQAGGIPSFNIGGSKRVDKRDFVKWLEDRKREKAAKWQPSLIQKAKSINRHLLDN